MGGYNMNMDLVSFFELAGVFGILLLVYTFRAGVTDFVYLAVKNWKQTAFVFICMAGGLVGGLYASGDSQLLQIYSLALPLPAENPGVAQIDKCREFVAAKAEHRPGYIDPNPSLDDYVLIGAHSYWDTCAQTFGMNYWKHDISINGQNGGQILCKAYLQDSYRSGIVDSWCNTVLSPPSAKPPSVQKAGSRVYTVVRSG